MSILDEIDSGLDVDALRDVSKAVNGLRTEDNAVLMVTHYKVPPAGPHDTPSHCTPSLATHSRLVRMPSFSEWFPTPFPRCPAGG